MRPAHRYKQFSGSLYPEKQVCSCHHKVVTLFRSTNSERSSRPANYLWTLLACAVLQVGSAFLALSAASPKEAGVNPPKESKENIARKQPPKPGTPAKPEFGSKGELPVVFKRPAPESMADLESIEQHVRKLVQKISPAVVAVEIGNGSGSGVVISSDGLVLTAGHVIGGGNRNVTFTFADGKKARGKTIGIGEDDDTGLMKITDAGPWPYVDTGDVESARRGDWVLAFGHPGGFDLRRSLVVRLGRIIRLSPNLQTDCTISPGDSGGPLIDMYGRVIGIHSFISSSVAENFHVPMSAFITDWDSMVNPQQEVVSARISGFVGVKGSDESPKGCRLIEIEKDSPASKAGLKVGDVILKVDGREILVAASFRRMIAEHSPGDSVSLSIRRGTKAMSLNVKLGAAKQTEEPGDED
jgi:serine protease Do